VVLAAGVVMDAVDGDDDGVVEADAAVVAVRPGFLVTTSGVEGVQPPGAKKAAGGKKLLAVCRPLPN